MKKLIYSLMVSMSFVVGLSACNNGSGSSGSGGGTAVTAQAVGNCAAGSVYTSQYGCLPQSSCPAGQGLYVSGATSICVVGTTNTCGVNNGYNGYYNGGYNPGYNNGLNTGCTTGYNNGYNGYNGYTGYTYAYGGSYTIGGGGYANLCAPGWFYSNHYCWNNLGYYYYSGY